MFYSPKIFFKDWRISAPFVVSGLLLLAGWYEVLRYIHPTTEQIFLHYNIVFGVDLIGAWWKLYLLPAGGLLIFLVNHLLSLHFYGDDRFLSRLINIATAVIMFFLFLAIYQIVGLNI